MVLQRATEFGGFDERLASLRQLLAGDRLARRRSSWTSGSTQRSVLADPDDLKRRGVALDLTGLVLYYDSVTCLMGLIGLLRYEATRE